MIAIGIDVGGTLVKYGLVRGRRILRQGSFSTAPVCRPRALEEAIAQVARSLLKECRTVVGIGVGIPGLVDYPAGVVHSCANLPGWDRVPLRAALERRLRIPVRVDNDVNAMTLAEWRFGAGRGASHLICITLGTGVGGGLVLGGRLHRGWQGSAGEIGHMPLAEKGTACSCGGVACLERTVGNRQIIRWVQGQIRSGRRTQILKLADGDPRRITPELIDEACRRKDPLALETWRRVGNTLGLTLAGLANLLNPERIVVGGGISKAGRWLFEPMRQTMRRRAMQGPGKVSILPARLGSSAGLIGAALLVGETGETGETGE